MGFLLILIGFLAILTVIVFVSASIKVKESPFKTSIMPTRDNDTKTKNIKKRLSVMVSRSITLIIGYFVIISILSLVFSYMQVEKGHVKYLTFFGSVIEDKVYEEGPHLVNPMARAHTLKVQEVRYKYEPYKRGDGSNVAISKDGVTMDIEATFPAALNPQMAWQIGRRLGKNGYHEMMRQSAYAAVRTTMSTYNWEEAIKNQQKFSVDLGDAYKASVQENLKRLGMKDQKAKAAITFIPPKIRRMVPPKRIRQAINEESAAKRDLNRQKTLTEIAKEEANRRANEGMGVKKMFSELPEQYSTKQMSSIIRALASKTRAEALVKAVENENVDTIVISGGTDNNNTPVPAVTAK